MEVKKKIIYSLIRTYYKLKITINYNLLKLLKL